jgi:predicted RNA-binding Zn-ribbon protein involved in translation (DUF1610 family)
MIDRYECINCGHRAHRDRMKDAADLTCRLLPGETFTDKECPKCGSLAYPEEAIGRVERERWIRASREADDEL